MHFMFLAILSFLAQSLGNKEFGRRVPPSRSSTALYNALALTLCAIIFACMGGAQAASPTTMLLAVGFGILFVVTITLFIKDFSMGPLGLTSLIHSLSMLLPVLAGVFFFGESFTLKSGLGILCILAVLVLSANPKAGRDAMPLTRAWFFTALLAMISNGTLSVLQKTQQFLVGNGEIDQFSFWAFLFAAITAWLMVAYYGGIRRERIAWRRPSLYVTAASMGAGSAAGNYFVLSSLAYVPAIIAYPVVLGGMVLLNWAASLIIYRERTNLQGVITMMIGLAGIVLLSI